MTIYNEFEWNNNTYFVAAEIRICTEGYGADCDGNRGIVRNVSEILALTILDENDVDVTTELSIPLDASIEAWVSSFEHGDY